MAFFIKRNGDKDRSRNPKNRSRKNKNIPYPSNKGQHSDHHGKDGGQVG